MRTSIQQQFRAYLTRESVVWFVLALGSCVVLIVFTASTMFGYQPPTWIGFVFSVIAAISAVGMTYRGMGTRPVPDAELAGIADSSLWHTTRAEWKVEKEIVLDPVYCRFLGSSELGV